MSDAFPITIFHNPKCGTSRNTLAMVQAAGYAPTVVEYMAAGWSEAVLKDLLAASGMTARELLREKSTPADLQGLLAPETSDDEIIAAMVEHPILVNRPIVRTPLGTKLCRPSEQVLELLEWRPESFTKEDGEVVKVSQA
ncbi:MAG: arsenate reductase (glutaredoxin) [Caulobacterales bacterium 68-7]|nr:MAG: arsenate reductase (glutaredoxin) [Caulobacterales bacterium 68-7]